MTHLSKFYRKFAVPALAATLVVSAMVPTVAADYTDVSERYKKAVDYLEVHKITEGLTATSFGTGKSIKRSDAAVLLAKAMELDTENVPVSKFTDVPDRAKKYVDALKAKGIINGKTVERFASDQLITRGEAALMLAKAYALETGITVNTFTDVSSKYENAVNALLDNKVTSGKTDTLFGVEHELTRGEFAIFLYKLSAVHIPGSEFSVVSEADLTAALNDNKVGEVVLTNDIEATTLPAIKRNVRIDLNGHILTGDIEYEDHSGSGEIQLLSAKAGGTLQGDLTIDAPNSDFTVGENVEVTDKTIIINVKENTFYNNGVLNSVDIRDNDGISFANQIQGLIKGEVAVNTAGNVKLVGDMDLVTINEAATVTVSDNAAIKNLVVTVNDVKLNAPTGTVENLRASSGVIVKDSAGKAIDVNPGVSEPDGSNPGSDAGSTASTIESINTKLASQASALETLTFKGVEDAKLFELNQALANPNLSIGDLIMNADYDRNSKISEDEFAAYFGSLPKNAVSGDSADALAFQALQNIYGNKEIMDGVIREINATIQKQVLATPIEFLELEGVALDKLVALNDALYGNGLNLSTLIMGADHNRNKIVTQSEFAAYIGSLPSNTIVGDSAEAEVFKALQNIFGNALKNTIFTINFKFEMQGLNIDTLLFNDVPYEKLKELNNVLPFGGLNLEALLEDADADGSGRITEEEFAVFFRGLPSDTITEDSTEAKIFRVLQSIYQ